MGSSNTRFYGTPVPRLLSTLDFEDKRVLDLGAGDGEILYGLGDKLNYSHVSAVEISRDRVSTMSRELPRVSCYNEDATDTHFSENSFDIIICNQVIEHVDDEDKLLAEIDRLLDVGGMCYLSTVFKEKYHFGYHRNRFGERVLDPTHVREYTDIELYRKVKKLFGRVLQYKIPVWFSTTDYILPRLGIQGHCYEDSWILRQLRRFKLPIVGYYTWEFLLWKK